MTIKAQSKRWSPSKDLDTPFKRAKAQWDSRFGSVLAEAKTWRIASFVCLGLLFFCACGMIYLGALPKVVPHIVQIDTASGQTVYRGEAQTSWASFKPKEAVIRFHLRRFIENIRTISSDKDVVKRNLLDAYAYVSPSVATVLNGYFRTSNPLNRVGQTRVTVEVTAMVPLSKTSWQCDWLETIWNLHGHVEYTQKWRMTVLLEQRTPKTQDQLEKNPIGLTLEEFHWAPIKS